MLKICRKVKPVSFLCYRLSEWIKCMYTERGLVGGGGSDSDLSLHPKIVWLVLQSREDPWGKRIPCYYAKIAELVTSIFFFGKAQQKPQHNSTKDKEIILTTPPLTFKGFLFLSADFP